jgi:hypothetical protein
MAGGRTAELSFLREAGAAVQVAHSRKAYRAVVAVDDVSFSVREGEIFGILDRSVPATSGARGHLLVWAVSAAPCSWAASHSFGDPDRTRALVRIAGGWTLVLVVDFHRSCSCTFWPKQRAAGAPRGGDERGPRR